MILLESTYCFGLESFPDGHEKHKDLVAIFRELSFGLHDGMMFIVSVMGTGALYNTDHTWLYRWKNISHSL
jgi:hypothetical protein